MEDARRRRLEGEHHRRPGHPLGHRPQSLDQSSMAQVDAVEVADRHGAAAERVGEINETVKKDHAGKSRRTSIWNPGSTSSPLSVSETCSIRICALGE